jgi:hypothetical protein
LTILYKLHLGVIQNRDVDDPQLTFPLQFTANISITAHLIEPESEYPPRTRTMTVYYDYLNKKARIDIDPGYEAAKIHVRRYDYKQEYMIRLPPINDCKRSYLTELMLYPAMPIDATFVGSNVIINEIPCHQYLFEDIETRLHFYMSSHDNAPVRLILESFDGYESTQMLTYDYYNVTLDAPSQDLFAVSAVAEAASSSSDCEEHRGGFPYIHIFHYFVRV